MVDQPEQSLHSQLLIFGQKTGGLNGKAKKEVREDHELLGGQAARNDQRARKKLRLASLAMAGSQICRITATCCTD